MTVIELKEKLIARISNTDDEELLDQISRVIDLETRMDEIYEMSPEEIEAVKEGIAQLDNGQWVSNDEANKMIDKCLGK
ncbi:MAG TPA: hypothetical protein VK668_00045 [Mucilaginibacter sp.]|nr:hypothetical protein [Mucilaginibacter sp.]